MSNTNKISRSNKHNRIIDAAVEVIAEKGYHLSRISDIAKRAQVADGTIYLYFKNKESILMTIFEEKMGLLIAEVKAALLEKNDPRAQLKEFIRQHFIHVETYPALARVLQVELRQSRQFIREYRPEKLWDYLRIVGEIIQAGQSKGDFRADLDPFILQWSLFGTLDELSVQWILSKKRERFNLEQVVHQVSAVFLSGLVKT